MVFPTKPNSGLVVTLHNGERQCFIKENEDNQSSGGSGGTEKCSKKDTACESMRQSHCDSGVQVTDGRYASTYQITHCHLAPTSPSEEVSEFPLQRKLLNSGDSHFKIGADLERGELRRDNVSPERVNARLKHPDEFYNSLRKYSKLSANRTIEIVEKLNTKHPNNNPTTKDVSSHVNKNNRHERAPGKHFQCENSVRHGQSQTCEISKWLHQDRIKLGPKPPFTTTIDVRELQKLSNKEKGGLRSVTLPNIAVSVGPSFCLEDEIQDNTLPSQFHNDNMDLVQNIHNQQDTKDIEIQTEANAVIYENEVARHKHNFEVKEPNYSKVNIGIDENKNAPRHEKGGNGLNVDIDVKNYQQFFSESYDIQSNSNDEFLIDAIQRWLNMILVQTGRCTDTCELNFIFQYLYKRLKMLKIQSDGIFNEESNYKIKTNYLVDNDDLSVIVSDDIAMKIAIDRLTDLLMDKVRTIYKKKMVIYTNLENRNLKIKEILPKLEDDFNIRCATDVSLQTDEKKDEPLNIEAKVMKEWNKKCTSSSLANIQKVIEDWLDFFNLPENIKNYRTIAVISLASEIKKRQDRQSYIQARSSSYVVSDETELDYFRYLVFKWNNKYFHRRRLEAFENVKTLYYRIQKQTSQNNLKDLYSEHIDAINTVAYPVLIQDNFYSANENVKCLQTDVNKSKSTPITLNNRTNQKIHCLQLSNVGSITFNHDPYEEFDQFVKFWSQEITTDVFTPQEANVSEKAALGIYNGIWKAIIKLNYKDLNQDQFHYEDLLEKEIDELIDCLPQTQELISKRHIFKVRLIEKTIITMKFVCKNRVMSLKNKLILKILDYLEPLQINKTDGFKSIMACITSITEMFILWSKYLNENQEKAKVYDKKLSKELDKFFHVLKEKFDKELETLNFDIFHKNIINQLQQINMPQQVLFEEADKILLGLEIDQWFLDLSASSKNIFEDDSHEKIIKDILVTLVKETDNNVSMNDDDKYSKLHTDIHQLLEKNLIKEDNVNIDFLASELINRIENMRQSCPRNVQNSDISNINSQSFAEKITKYQLGIHENENYGSNVCDCKDIISTDETLREIPDEITENSILHTCKAYDGPSISGDKKNKVKWHTLNETMIQSDNSENSMKTALDSDVQQSNSNSKVDQETQAQERNFKKCFCKTSTVSLANLLFLRDEGNAALVNHDQDAPEIPPKVLKSCGKCNLQTYRDGNDSSRNSVRECQTDSINEELEKIAPCYKRENSQDAGKNVLMNNHSMCNCMVGSSNQGQSNLDTDAGSKGRCHCTHRFQNFRNVFHSQTENDEHPPFIHVLYPYPYFF